VALSAAQQKTLRHPCKDIAKLYFWADFALFVFFVCFHILIAETKDR
jgi:hypothetical protein